MQFTRLRLNGFKSFVDPTDLVIAEGLTGVVGPNGCGKSNLLEALRWVMGENRPTAMRGGGMEDVIFAGTATRPARHYAEVSLAVDNAARRAPAAFNDAEMLEIARRITRDAGSAYKCNGREVRARDVQMLFADASTGAHSPALVRQGQISELINAKPKARRRVLEEAAGISGLYQRRHEAELKLKGAEANLARVDDVLEQLASQLQQLARQAKQAARYRAIGSELRQAEGMLLYRRWREADEARAAAEDELHQRVAAAAQAEARVREAVKAREAAETALPPLREEEAIAAALVQRLTVQRDSLSDQEARAAQTIETLTRRIAQLSHDIEREAGLNRDAGETIERLEWEAREIVKASEGFDAALTEATDAAQEAAQVLQAHGRAERRAPLQVALDQLAPVGLEVAGDFRVAVARQVDQPMVGVQVEHHQLARASRRAGCARQGLLSAQAIDQAGLAGVRAAGHGDFRTGIRRELRQIVDAVAVDCALEKLAGVIHGLDQVAECGDNSKFA